MLPGDTVVIITPPDVARTQYLDNLAEYIQRADPKNCEEAQAMANIRARLLFTFEARELTTRDDLVFADVPVDRTALDRKATRVVAGWVLAGLSTVIGFGGAALEATQKAQARDIILYLLAGVAGALGLRLAYIHDRILSHESTQLTGLTLEKARIKSRAMQESQFLERERGLIQEIDAKLRHSPHRNEVLAKAKRPPALSVLLS
jgi:hypothetical protein